MQLARYLMVSNGDCGQLRLVNDGYNARLASQWLLIPIVTPMVIDWPVNGY